MNDYGPDLALVHHLGFAFHAESVAPGILALLEPLRVRRGLVLELGCGSGLLTKRLVEAGYRVIATDASPDMVDLAREYAPGAEFRILTMPDDELPPADAVVSVGHPINYLPDLAAVHRALRAAARALRPGGVLAMDICDLEWAAARRAAPPYVRVEDDWAIVTRFSIPSADRFVRDITTFVRQPDGSFRRRDERHENVLVDTATLPSLLREEGLDVTVKPAFGSETLPAGLRALVGTRSE